MYNLFQGGSFPQCFPDFHLANLRNKSLLESYFHYFDTLESVGWKASLSSTPGVPSAGPKFALTSEQLWESRAPRTLPGPTLFKGVLGS